MVELYEYSMLMSFSQAKAYLRLLPNLLHVVLSMRLGSPPTKA